VVKILKEPLLHFLFIGACLFGLYIWINPAALQSDKRIVVDQGKINNLTMRFKRVWQREPTKQEIKGLIDNYVTEEIYYREALAMGIDKDDPVIRRRLRQKMEIYTDNLAATLTPSEEELNQYLHQHPDKFKTDSRYSFRQIYINTDLPPAKLQANIKMIKTALQTGGSVSSDQSLLPARFTDVDAQSIDRTFGKGFAAQLGTLALDKWSPPLHSGLGLHFVKLSARLPGQLPALSLIHDQVEREWRFDKEQAIKEALRQKLQERYDVVIEHTIAPN